MALLGALVSLGRGFAGTVEFVVVEFGDDRWKLSVNPETGTITSISFVDRGPGGEWGEITHLLVDHRDVNGGSWPHARIVTFNGEIVPQWGWLTTNAYVDAALSDELFERPSEIRDR